MLFDSTWNNSLLFYLKLWTMKESALKCSIENIIMVVSYHICTYLLIELHGAERWYIILNCINNSFAHYSRILFHVLCLCPSVHLVRFQNKKISLIGVMYCTSSLVVLHYENSWSLVSSKRMVPLSLWLLTWWFYIVAWKS